MSIVSCSRTKFNVDDLVYTSCCMLCFVGLNSVKKSGRNVISPIEQQSTPKLSCAVTVMMYVLSSVLC